jgi:hypothetical protein
MQVSVLVKLQMTPTEAYKVNLSLPTGTPTKDDPFHFRVTQEVSGVDKDNVLDVAIGDGSHYFVGVAPPASLLEIGGIDKVVKNLQVVVAEGEYDPGSGTFKAITQ